MTPEELDKLESLAAEGRRLDRECVEAGRHADYVGARRLALASDAITRDLSARLLDAAHALIAAARDLHTLQIGVGHPMWLPSVADALSMDDPFAATSGDVLERVRALAREAERLRAFVPVTEP